MEELIKYLPQIIATAFVVILTPFSKYISRKLVRKYGSQKSETRIMQITRVIAILANFTCLFSLAVIWGVKPQNMLIALSSIFAVIGVAMFAQWSILSNVTAGIVIFFTTPLRIGDKIKIMDKDMPITATIENVLTFYIYLRSLEGDLIILSNTAFLQKTILLVREEAEMDE